MDSLTNKQENVLFQEAANISLKFDIVGEITSIKLQNKGYINRTFLVSTFDDEKDEEHYYILQRVNDNVFHDIEMLINNFVYLNRFMKGNFYLYHRDFDIPDCSIPSLIKTIDGGYYVSESGGFWRMLTYFEHVYSLNIPKSAKQFRSAGAAFGKFIKQMSFSPLDCIGEVIPHFHDTPSRYRHLEESIATDPLGRVKEVKWEIDFIRNRKNMFSKISDALDSGIIPHRITHNDTNLNNILFDEITDEPVAIIDLDTVMPSSPLYDFGDSIRIGSNAAEDDEKDLSKVFCNLEMYEAYTEGWLSSCGDILTDNEIALLPYAARTISIEDGIRFLDDYISGDTYYKTTYEGQNLDRSRTQLTLVADMERKEDRINEIFKRLIPIYTKKGE